MCDWLCSFQIYLLCDFVTFVVFMYINEISGPYSHMNSTLYTHYSFAFICNIHHFLNKHQFSLLPFLYFLRKFTLILRIICIFLSYHLLIILSISHLLKHHRIPLHPNCSANFLGDPSNLDDRSLCFSILVHYP